MVRPSARKRRIKILPAGCGVLKWLAPQKMNQQLRVSNQCGNNNVNRTWKSPDGRIWTEIPKLRGCKYQTEAGLIFWITKPLEDIKIQYANCAFIIKAAREEAEVEKRALAAENIKVRGELGEIKVERDHLRSLSECGICYEVINGDDNNFFCVFMPCCHRICNNCAARLQSNKCAFCNTKIRALHRLY